MRHGNAHPEVGGSLRLGDWLIEPSRNLLTDDSQQVSIEPKMMDVLVFLASRAGQVVTKSDIADTVWADTFVTESVVTRAIAGLRRALGDDARSPRFIETIAKRGYRLIADVQTPSGGEDAPRLISRPVQPLSGSTHWTPSRYPVGQWVSGFSFYGRRRQLIEILDGQRSLVWLLGTRAIGKTSLLRQVEQIALYPPEDETSPDFLPLYWDLQGIETSEELHQDFSALLDDAARRLEAHDIDRGAIQDEDFFLSLRRLRRHLSARGQRLLLLIDEAEELVQLSRQDPRLLPKLRRALQSSSGIWAVLAASSHLWQLAEQRDETSPLLHGLAPPLYLGRLDPEDSVALIHQAQDPNSQSPFSDQQARRIAHAGGDHPYLVQMLCREALELGDLQMAIDAVSADPAVTFFFQVDGDLLSEDERRLLRRLAELSAPKTADQLARDESSAEVLARLVSLEKLGIVHRSADQQFEIASVVRLRWLRATERI
ncbi:MAG: winged helix-turn-helix domain-containing protein [Thermoanaerobaculia bacterium]|nr:winged helix-turn-helix domain-containing protein [Thermoanaerobaculia bacterium]